MDDKTINTPGRQQTIKQVIITNNKHDVLTVVFIFLNMNNTVGVDVDGL